MTTIMIDAINRVTHMSIARDLPTGGGLGRSGRPLFGNVNNIHLCEVVAVHEEVHGPAGPESWHPGTFQITPMTLDLLDATQDPEGLGPVDLVFTGYKTVEPEGVTKKFRVATKIETPGSGTYNRGTEFPRTLTLRPYRFILGGGPKFDGLTLAKNWDANAPSVYADARRGVWVTCVEGGEAVDHMRNVLTAHGLVAPTNGG